MSRSNELFLAVDGGGTGCRARLCDVGGARLGEANGGPANIRFGLTEAFASVSDATLKCLEQARLLPSDLPRITACLALAGATEPTELAAARLQKQAFGKAILTADAHAACVGAHNGGDGGVVIVGTGSIGWAVLHGEQHRVGGWGLPVSDEGSGAWIGREALRRVFCAFDGRMSRTPLLQRIFERYDSNPHAAVEILRLAAAHIDAIATRLIALGVPRLSLMGGLASHVEPLLPLTTRQHLVEPLGDPLDGALLLARAAAEPVAA
jgi:glucosamine kinase